MIKFIASDLDGTLLPPSKIMPEETFALNKKLYSRGIIFAPASGRQLPNLKKLFAPVLDKIAIIAENGGIGWYNGEVVYSNPTPKDGVMRALDIIRQEKDLYPLLSCADCAYYDSDFAPFFEISKKSYTNIQRADLDEIARSETVIKISVWDAKPPCAEHGGIILPPKLQGLRAMVSGYDWLDVSVSSANKGNALKALLNICNVKKNECMAFGDHMNDLEMLLESGLPYVTENAFAGLKAHIKNTVPSNAENGVIQKIKEIL
ncbi:MAG: Cof-type HAD-IIB family hydrolase [Clostridia bacterium]|nr:Cof-type HAD-IIB family hydrolase [Clostridia bacterium]